MVPSVIIVCVSMPLRESTRTIPSEENGYGPSRSSIQSSSSAATRSPRTVRGRSRGVQYVTGTPLSERSRVSRKSPIATVTRYDDAGSSRCQRVTVVPSSPVSRDSRVPFATPSIGAGAVIVKS